MKVQICSSGTPSSEESLSAPLPLKAAEETSQGSPKAGGRLGLWSGLIVEDGIDTGLGLAVHLALTENFVIDWVGRVIPEETTAFVHVSGDV